MKELRETSRDNGSHSASLEEQTGQEVPGDLSKVSEVAAERTSITFKDEGSTQTSADGQIPQDR